MRALLPLLRHSAAGGRAVATSAAAQPAAAGGPPGPASVPSPRTALVQGASRGLGLEFVRQLLLRETSVVATCRDPAGAGALQALQREAGSERLAIVPLDCTSEESIERAVAQVAELHPCLDLLINAAGVLHVPNVMSPETALSRLSLNSLLLCHQVNAFGPILVSKAFLPLLAKAAAAHLATEDRPAVIASISARVGSIGDNGTVSTPLLVGTHMQVATILLHPGTVDTDLSKPFQKNVPPGKLFTRERAVQQLLDIIDRTTMQQNGQFFDWKGEQIEW
eukprot:scaffold19.g1812.t1